MAYAINFCMMSLCASLAESLCRHTNICTHTHTHTQGFPRARVHRGHLKEEGLGEELPTLPGWRMSKTTCIAEVSPCDQAGHWATTELFIWTITRSANINYCSQFIVWWKCTGCKLSMKRLVVPPAHAYFDNYVMICRHFKTRGIPGKVPCWIALVFLPLRAGYKTFSKFQSSSDLYTHFRRSSYARIRHPWLSTQGRLYWEHIQVPLPCLSPSTERRCSAFLWALALHWMRCWNIRYKVSFVRHTLLMCHTHMYVGSGIFLL